MTVQLRAKTSGAKTSGAKTSGAKTSGAKTSGAKTAAAKASRAEAPGKASRAKASRAPHSRWQAAVIALLSLAITSGGTSLSFGISQKSLGRLSMLGMRPSLNLRRPPTPLTARGLTEDLRRHGYHECNPYDFVGLGPYGPYRKLPIGRIAIPQKGGHTADYGYDVLVHFHGQTALRMTLAQVAKGEAFVGIDLGNGSGAYSDEFLSRQTWPRLRDAIESALKAQSGRAEAHIRHVGLMAWSAGYGAVNEILKYHANDIDAVVLLDGLHAARDLRAGRGIGSRKVVAGPIAPTIEYARLALAGDKLFVFTHSEIDPVLYPSTGDTARFLIDEFGLAMRLAPPNNDPFGLRASVDVLGLHVWSYRGNDKPAHCTHLTHIERVLHEVIEPAWDTPAMDRDVPATPAPRLGPAPGLQNLAQSRQSQELEPELGSTATATSDETGNATSGPQAEPPTPGEEARVAPDPPEASTSAG